MNKKDYENHVSIALKNIAKGAFLTVSDGKNINTMTIGWGSFGIIWGKPIFMVMVRKSRYTYQLIDNIYEFTVSFPDKNKLKKELVFCGTNSGRDFNKFKECKLNPVPGKKIETPVINEARLHFECRIIYKQEMNNELLDSDYNNNWYPEKDFHTLYYGEVLGSYIG